jgi:hypothetical protein
LFFGGLMLLGGRVADVFGARRTTLIGLALFTAASLLCGTAGAAATLLIGRALQGVGAALMSPAALACVLALFPDGARGRALGIWSAISGIGVALGLVLGGLITSELGWRWIFTINVPLGAALLLAIPSFVPVRPRSQPRDRRLDLAGAVLVTAGTGAALYALINAGSQGWAAPSTLAAFAGAALAWTALALVEARTARPLLRVALLTRRPTAAGSYLMLTATAVMVGGYFLGSFLLQRGYGYSAVHLGVAFLPAALAGAAGAHTASHLLGHVRARAVAVSGLTLAAIGCAIAATWHSPVGVATGMTIATLGNAAVFVTAFTAALTDAPGDESGLRSALVNTFHELGGAAGVAVLSTVAGGALVSASTIGAFSRGFAAAAAIAAVAAIGAAALVPSVLRDPTQRPAH